jgi:hypothetical protein
VLVHLTLAQLRGAPGGLAAEDAWAAARASQPGWLTGPEADAALCDATVVPVVTGHVDWAALDRLAETFLLSHAIGRHTGPDGTGQGGSPGHGRFDMPGNHGGSGQAGSPGPGQSDGQPGRPGAGGALAGSLSDDGEPVACGCTRGGSAGPGGGSLSPATRDRLRRALLGLAADTLSGPGGLAARLRAALDGKPLTTLSLPLDIGAATETIPAHLRRAATTRTARSPAATNHQACATSTTSPPDPAAGRPACPTWCPYAASIT